MAGTFPRSVADSGGGLTHDRTFRNSTGCLDRAATHDLSLTSAAQVRAEIKEHFESAREAAIGAGSNPADADRTAVAALGDPRAANCEYRI